MRSFDEPCGSWQVVQPSRLGACSHRNGPRFSAWQDVHSSATESPLRSSFTLVDPCMLWQVEHCILPSRTGMCPDRSTFATLSRWQVAHTSLRRFLQLVDSSSAEWTRVTRHAAQAAVFVLTAVPERVLPAVVAGRAGRVHLLRRELGKAFDRVGDRVAHVQTAGP